MVFASNSIHWGGKKLEESRRVESWLLGSGAGMLCEERLAISLATR